jgi:hypothetical protein
MGAVVLSSASVDAGMDPSPRKSRGRCIASQSEVPLIRRRASRGLMTRHGEAARDGGDGFTPAGHIYPRFSAGKRARAATREWLHEKAMIQPSRFVRVGGACGRVTARERWNPLDARRQSDNGAINLRWRVRCLSYGYYLPACNHTLKLFAARTSPRRLYIALIARQ